MRILQDQFDKNVIVTSVDSLVNWARKSSSMADDIRLGMLRH